MYFWILFVYIYKVFGKLLSNCVKTIIFYKRSLIKYRGEKITPSFKYLDNGFDRTIVHVTQTMVLFEQSSQWIHLAYGSNKTIVQVGSLGLQFCQNPSLSCLLGWWFHCWIKNSFAAEDIYNKNCINRHVVLFLN